jgi:hypothetical protein
MRVKSLILIHVISPILFGGVIYISFRSLSLRLFEWLEVIGLKTITLSIRNIFNPLKNDLPYWFYFSLPDGLWVYSFSCALLILWRNNHEKAKLWLLIPFFSGIIIEIAQGLKIFRGTFDVIDLVFSIIALVSSVVIINYKFKQNDKKEQLLH